LKALEAALGFPKAIAHSALPFVSGGSHSIHHRFGSFRGFGHTSSSVIPGSLR
jgi:hypothetical protein